MNLDICSHLYRELFEKKSVDCHPCLYLRCYPNIWPDEDAFKEFLTGADSSVQLSAAKKIYFAMQAEEDIFLPHFVLQNLIWVQQNRLAKNSTGYIPQDHVIHSVHLYILGIYVFFNIPIFQRKLLHIVGISYQTEDLMMLQFIKKWKLFAMYHDVGYVFEALVDRDGSITEENILSQYELLRKQILLQYVSRSVSRLIVANALIRRSQISFNIDDYPIVESNWLNEFGDKLPSQAVRQELLSCVEYKMLEDVQSPQGFRHVLPLLHCTKRLSVVLDKRNCPIAFFKWDDDQNVRKIYNSSTILSKNIIDAITSSLPIDVVDITIRYYICISDFQHTFLNYNSKYIAFQEEAQTYDMSLPEELRIQFALIYHDKCVTQAYYDINDWHRKNAKDVSSTVPTEPIRDYTADMAEHLSRALMNEVKDRANIHIRGSQTITVENLRDTITKLSKEIKAINPSTVINEATSAYEKSIGVPSKIFTYSRRLYENIRSALGCNEAKHPYMKIDHQKLYLFPFSFEKDNTCAASLYRQMEFLAGRLQLDIAKLQYYRPNYSTCDHGVLSAAMVFDALSFCFYLKKAIGEAPPANFAWDTLAGIDQILSEESLFVYADAIFSILLHNVYTETAKPEYGVRYKQSIDQNPFSYFCALMDCLQKWCRPKQIDSSVMDLPGDHYLGHNFDISVSEGRLRIICNSTRVGKMQEQLEYAEDYLPGILNLICITEEEL